MVKQSVVLTRKQIDDYLSFIFQDYKNYDLIISRLLSVLGFKPSLCGTSFIREAIKFCCQYNATTKIHFNSEVYPAVAKTCGVTADCVERDIRTALHNCYFNGNLLQFNGICGYDVVSLTYPPTNVDFITQIVSWIKMYIVANNVGTIDRSV